MRPQPFGLDNPPPSTALVPSTFYPGTADAATAQTLTVAAGQTVAGIEFRVLTAPTFKVSGTVVDEAGMPVSGAIVMLAGDSRATGGISGHAGESSSDASGRFAIESVTSGPYYATALLVPSVAGKDGGVTSSVAGKPVNPVQVIVDDADVEGVTIVLQR